MVTIRLTRDFKEFLKLLNSEKIEYLLIGGYAVALYGYVRPTKDMDLWVSIHPHNLDRLIVALEKFGFAPGSITRDLFTGTQSVFRMGFPPNRLELLTSITGIDFVEAYPRRVTVDMEGVPVSVISYDDLKRNKTASNRPNDRTDVDQLERARSRSGPRKKPGAS